MPRIEKKEFMTHVVPMHCGDPLGKQQTITNKQNELRNISSHSFVMERTCCGSTFSLVYFSFSYVLNSLSYIIIPQNEGK